MELAKNIDEVIDKLESIIESSISNAQREGYFAALYLKVTKKVKEGIKNHFFENGPRMEKLDVIFANRYLAAYYARQEKKETTQSWKLAFDLAGQYWPIVLQHLLIGMNAHINLDLGIAAATVQAEEDQPIEDLKTDFDRINKILADLVGQVESELAMIWPPLKWILKVSGRLDDAIVNFSMELARDAAWDFACKLAKNTQEEWPALINEKDLEVAKAIHVINPKGTLLSIPLRLIRLGERGSIAYKIKVI